MSDTNENGANEKIGNDAYTSAPDIFDFHQGVWEPWKEYYIAYDKIHDRYDMQSKEEQAAFADTLRRETARVDQFITQQQQNIDEQLRYTERVLVRIQSADDPEEQDESYRVQRDELNDLLDDELRHLIEFTRHNFEAVRHLAKQHAMRLTDIMQTWPLDTQRFNLTRIEAKRLLDLCSKRGHAPVTARDKQTWTASFWVHPENLTEVQAALTFHLQPQQSLFAESLYLDNKDFELYLSCLEHDVNACRFTVTLLQSQRLFDIERRVHMDLDTKRSTRDHVTLPVDRLDDFLAGQYSRATQKGSMEEELLESLKQSVQIYHPVARKSCTQTSFRVGPCHLTLDTDITYQRQTDWAAKNASAPVPFPFAVLHIHGLSENTLFPGWLLELIGSSLLYEVPTYSCFLQGVLCLYEPQLPLVPYWEEDLKRVDIRRVARDAPIHDRQITSRVLIPEVDGTRPMGYLDHVLERPPGEPRPPSVRRRESTQLHYAKSNAGSGFLRSVPVWLRGPSMRRWRQNSLSTLRGSIKEGIERRRTAASQRDFYDPVAIAMEPDDDSRDSREKGYYYEEEEEETDEERKKREKKEKKAQKKKEKEDPRLEPKVFFANERTFIHWLQLGALILASALTLLNFGDQMSVVAGAFLFGVCMVIAIYAYGRFRYRAYQIKTRPQFRYDDIYGPIGLCILLVAAIVLNAVLKYLHPPSTSSYLGINNTTQQQPTTGPYQHTTP
ncbi:hypothetical protein BCR43DRAFT_517287 [Syncephalastrum racemosum]|uniref:VTC domain-domain-containing protein n=1 Tax=Syncephalastrum racemosum TaxID=13706 RepID=A0A1X2H3M8_SYNRA|nr:hypothetical protein BCR43DRAFT_517287 [Syncephalastrum racemosum]